MDHWLTNLKTINLIKRAKIKKPKKLMLILKKIFQRLDKSITAKIKLTNNFNLATLFNKKYKTTIKVIIENKQPISM
jgi:hypothetical protein